MSKKHKVVFRKMPSSGCIKIPVGEFWERGWIFENFYGWTWLGKFAGPGRWVAIHKTLGEPDIKERQEIEKQFENAPTPDGLPEIVWTRGME